jgi:hypothetical protein
LICFPVVQSSPENKISHNHNTTGYLSKYHNWNIRSKFTCPGSQRYSTRSYRVKVNPKPPPISLPSVPLLKVLREETQERFNSTKDQNKSKSSFGFVCSSTWILISFIICLCHIPRCTRIYYHLTKVDLSEYTTDNDSSLFQTYVLPDYSRMFGIKSLATWSSRIFMGISPLYVTIPNNGLIDGTHSIQTSSGYTDSNINQDSACKFVYQREQNVEKRRKAEQARWYYHKRYHEIYLHDFCLNLI